MSQLRILVAEDDPVTLEAIASSLESEGFEAILARNGSEALEQWRQEQPDLICLDIMMPELDGFEACRQIRASDTAVPVLFLSAKNEEIDVVVGLELGADDFIRKPFGKRELIARIRTAIKRHRESIPAVAPGSGEGFRMGDLQVFPRQLRAQRGEASIELSPREVGILEVLHAHEGEVVSRDELLNACWGVDYFPASRTLDQHIAKLRKRIEEDPANPALIETIRGVGYRYRPEAR